MDVSDISNLYILIAPAVGILAGTIVAQIAGERARRWMAAHDRDYRSPRLAEQLVFGPVLSSLDTVHRYSQLRRARGESRGTSILFWAAIMAAILSGCLGLALAWLG